MPTAKASIWNPLFCRNGALIDQVLDAAPQGIWAIDLEGRTLYANPALLALLATSPDTLLASHAFDFVPIEDRAHTRTELEKHIAGTGRPFETRLVRADGRMIWASVTTSVLRDGSDTAVGLLGFVSDMTEQRSTTAALVQAEDQFRLAVDAAQLGIFHCDCPLETSTFVWNHTLLRQMEIGPAETPSLALFYARVHSADRDTIARALENAARHHAPYDVEYRVLSPNPTLHVTRWIRAIGRYTYDANGNPLRIDGITIDVTDRKLLETALREESRATRTVFSLSKKLVSELDLETLVHSITDAGQFITGADAAAFIHRVEEDGHDAYLVYALTGEGQHARGLPVPHPTELFGPAFLGQGPVRIGDADADPRGRAALLHRALGEEGRPMRSFLAVPVVSRFGHIIGALCCGHPEPYKFTDRDERGLAGIASHAAIAMDNARLLNEARQASAAKDKFLAVLSHELRTPLNPVLLQASEMAADESLPEPVRANLETIRRNVELEARLIDDLLDITRIARGRIDLQQATVDAHRLLRDVAAMFKADLADKKLALSMDLAAARHYVWADAARLQQVWWNLLRNAIKFTPAEGTIRIRTHNLLGDAAAHAVGGAVPDPGMLAVEISDSGIGIRPDQVDRLFRPFEQADDTIGRRFGGLGLGLAISRSLVEMHEGTLTARSAGHAQGSTFTATLPTVPAPAGSATARTDSTAAPTGALRVLLVEDHADTAQTMARLLVGMGHHPRVAHTLAEALRISSEGRFDLLICDIGLPDGSGLDLLAMLPEGQAPAHAVALTGYGMEEDVQRSQAAGFEEHLTKPLNIERLAGLLRKVAGETDTGERQPEPANFQI
jgi:PAS domain S-box-containing protein